MYGVIVPHAVNETDHDPPQELAKRPGFPTVLCQKMVEENDIGDHLLDLGTLGVMRALCRGDQQTKHKGGYGPDETRAQAHDVLCVTAEVLLRQCTSQERPEHDTAQDAHQCNA